VWIAHSLFSFSEPIAALREMAECVRPGGLVAVLENDTLHQLFIPWPPRLELAVRTAELDYLSERYESPEKYYVARRLPSLFVEAGLQPLSVTMQCSVRQPPFGEHLAAFFQAYVDRLAERVAPRLDRALALQFARLTDRESEGHLLRCPATTIGWLD